VTPARQRTGADAPQGRTAIFGGTFDPIHLGHLRAAEETREALGLGRILFVPSALPPHKRGSRGEAPIAPATQRLDWIRTAIADHPHFESDPVELSRSGPSYTVDTLLHFKARLAPARPLLILGWDAFAEIGSWHEPERIFELADLVVLTRPPLSPTRFTDHLPALLRGRAALDETETLAYPDWTQTWVQLLPITALEISSSEIRRRLRAGRSVRYLLFNSIYPSVVASDAYRAGARETT
jgi:nicotinate-nucleotide adenylyltransferase